MALLVTAAFTVTNIFLSFNSFSFSGALGPGGHTSNPPPREEFRAFDPEVELLFELFYRPHQSFVLLSTTGSSSVASS
jgi:hypothetical protein